jgi:hypothetical protein
MMMRILYKARLFPLLVSIVTFVLGFMRYTGDNLPYQDPTQELIEAQIAAIAYDEKMMAAGGILIVVSLVFLIAIKRIYRKIRS